MTEHKALSAFEQAKLQEEVEELKQRVETFRAAAQRVVDDIIAADPKLCVNAPASCPASALAWAAAFRLNKALALDTAKEKQND